MCCQSKESGDLCQTVLSPAMAMQWTALDRRVEAHLRAGDPIRKYAGIATVRCLSVLESHEQSLRDEKLHRLILTQFNAVPLQESRRAGA